MTAKTKEDIINASLLMKVGSEYCLAKGNRLAILGDAKDAYGAPVRRKGKVYLPTSPIENYMMKAPVSEKRTLSVKDKKEREYEVIALEDVKSVYGLSVAYDRMGLIVIGEDEIVFDRKCDLELMMGAMKRFIFEFPTAAEVYEDIKAYTYEFTHPFIHTTQERFDRLHAMYTSKESDVEGDPQRLKYLDTLIEDAEKIYRDLALPVSEGSDDYSRYVGLNPEKLPKNPNNTNDGYDIGGRLGVPTGSLMQLAFAYQVTRDIKYAKLAYDRALCFGEWEHWGPGHFLNCAVPSNSFAISLDWLYNTYSELYKTEPHYDVRVLEDILYEKGVKMGYLASLERWCPFPSERQGGLKNNGAFVYHKKINNWNAVCTAGMTVAALATITRPEYRLESASLISDGIENLAKWGLSQYAPDGSYIESPGYWCYGTNNLFSFISALMFSTGKDYGYLDTWGLDTTCYFAVHAESSDFKSWSYHDGRVTSLDTSRFPFMAMAMEDAKLQSVRDAQLKNGKAPSIFDFIYERVDTKGTDANMPREYFMEGIDCFSARSGWEKGSIYVGLHGGYNRVPHGQLDSGSFIYHNKGVVWLHDLGSDNYNASRYFGRFGEYYRRNAEGNAVISVKGHEDMPYGQQLYAGGRIYKNGANPDTVYAVVDNKDVYAPYAKRAERGMLLTHGRTVTVIQDEIDFENPESGYWVNHYNLDEVDNVTLSDDGRCVYMTKEKDGEILRMRMSIVCPDEDIRFRLTDCYDFLYETTFRPGKSEELGGQPEYSRDRFGRIVIDFNDKASLRLAVVIEMQDKDAPVGYEWTDISEWKA